ncbi:hypothetical protein BD779DRAFT_1505846 [Infundibulicybe gibba]|nr:hypothetical protein BD779DRAFT_1505846 [Infundibulicybe gibba]
MVTGVHLLGNHFRFWNGRLHLLTDIKPPHAFAFLYATSTFHLSGHTKHSGPPMNPFPPFFFPLICTSLCLSTLALVVSTLAIGISPLLWIIPAAFAVTITYHTTILFISSSESTKSSRLFSAPAVVFAYLLTLLWACDFGFALTLVILLCSGKLESSVSGRNSGVLVASLVLTLFEAVVMGSIAWRCHKERRRITYSAKWRWKPSNPELSHWGIGQG